MDTQITFTAKKIADMLGVTRVTVMRRAKKENWPYIQKNGNGGIQHEYCLTSLPADVQKAAIAKESIPADLISTLAPEAALAALDRHLPVPAFSETLPRPTARKNRRHKRDASKPAIDTTPSLYNKEGIPPATQYEFEKLPAWSPERAISEGALRDNRVRTILAILREAEAVPRDWTKGKRRWIEFVAAKHAVKWQTIYRWLKKYDKRGIAGLEHRKSSREKPKAWTPEALDWWIGLCLKPAHRKMDLRALYEDILVIESHRRGWEIGCQESATWWYKKRVTPQLLALQKGGMRALDNVLPPVLRNYSDLAPFEMLVGDQHRFDFWVVDDDTGKVFRPEGYIWQDLRTRVIYGAAFDHRYDAHLCGLALRIGMRICGCCNAIYTDNGSSELSKYMMGILAEIRALGMKWEMTLETPMDILDVDGEDINPVVAPGTHTKAVVKNAKAKLVEKTNDSLEHILRSRFRVPGSVKRLTDDIHSQDVDHEEAMKLAAEGKLFLASEFYLTVYRVIDYYNREKAHRGVRREWVWHPIPPSVTPMDCLKACYADGWRPRMITDEAADLIFLKRASRTVHLGRIALNNDLYEHDLLLDLHGQRVDIRFHPIEQDVVLVYRGGKFLCPAFPVEYSSMKNKDLAKQKILEKRRKRREIAEQFRALTRHIPDFREYSKVPEAERVAAQVGVEKKRIEASRAALGRTLSPAELEAEIAKLEILNARLPDGTKVTLPRVAKALPPRPGYWISNTDRYLWCIKYEAMGGELCDEDRRFVEEEEMKMTPAERERWQFEREYGKS